MYIYFRTTNMYQYLYKIYCIIKNYYICCPILFQYIQCTYICKEAAHQCWKSTPICEYKSSSHSYCKCQLIIATCTLIAKVYLAYYVTSKIHKKVSLTYTTPISFVTVCLLCCGIVVCNLVFPCVKPCQSYIFHGRTTQNVKFVLWLCAEAIFWKNVKSCSGS